MNLFFKTQTGQENQKQLVNKAKYNLNSYISKLDVHIEKALKTQNNIANRKKKELMHQLQLIKERTYKETIKVRKMEEYFIKYCQAILQQDIKKWKNNDNFFKELFHYYQAKIKEKKIENILKKQQIKRKTVQLKERMRKVREQQAVKFNIKTQQIWLELAKKSVRTERFSSMKSQQKTRIKTQISFPLLPKNQPAQFTKHYLQPIKNLRNTDYQFKQTNDLLNTLKWYKKSKQTPKNWFQRMLFQQQNFKKLQQGLINQQSQRLTRSQTEQK